MASEKSYQRQFIILNGVLFIFGLGIHSLYPHWVDVFTLYTWLYLGSIMYTLHIVVTEGNKKNPSDAHLYTMGAMAARIFLSFISIVAYIYFIGTNKTAFIVNFFLLYFTYSFFEIKTLLLSLQPHSK